MVCPTVVSSPLQPSDRVGGIVYTDLTARAETRPHGSNDSDCPALAIAGAAARNAAADSRPVNCGRAWGRQPLAALARCPVHVHRPAADAARVALSGQGEPASRW